MEYTAMLSPGDAPRRPRKPMIATQSMILRSRTQIKTCWATG